MHDEELNDLYSSTNIVRVIKSRRMRWVGHVARMGEERRVYSKPVIGGVCLLNTDGGPRPKTTWVLTYIFYLYAVNCIV